MSGDRRKFDPARRRVLGALSVGAGLFACNEPFDPATLPFGLGVASGDARTDGALLWTRYLGGKPLRLQVWRGEPDAATLVLEAEPVVSAAGVVRHEVSGLDPGERYTFAFSELPSGDASPLGRFRTAIAPDVRELLRVGAVCCTRYGAPMTTLEHAGRRRDLDLFMFLGDAVYADGANTLEQYRLKWSRTLGEPGPRSFRAAHSLLATWDDHEFHNDWAQETGNPDKFEHASEAFFEHVPMRRLPDAPRRLWRSVRWGLTAEFFVLDSRGERRPSTRQLPHAEYLSNEQLAWLQRGLQESPCALKVILNSVPIGEFEGALFQTTVHDRWEGYPAQRERILSFIDELHIPGVLWVSGDFHLASLGRVSRAGPGSKALEVLVGPGANFANPSPSYPAPPQFDWASGLNNYAVLELDPFTVSVNVQYHDGTGRVLMEKRYELG